MNFGHIIIQKGGEYCTCGNRGCFEAYASMRVLKEKIANKKGLKNITGPELYDIIENEENLVKEEIDEFIQNLNIGLSSHINIFEPEAICIGGSFVYFENLLLNRLISKMNEENLAFNGEIPKIMTAKMR